MKKLMIFVLAAALAFGFVGTASAELAAEAEDLTTLNTRTGVSFAQTPVISGIGSGETLYVVTGGFLPADMTAASGLSVFEVATTKNAAGDYALNVAWGLGTGDGSPSGVTSSGLASPVLIDNAAGGSSVFFVANNVSSTIGATSGFTLRGMSARADGAEEISVVFESAVTNCGVVAPLAYSGTSLFFGTVMMESGSSPQMCDQNGNAGYVGGSTIYVVRTDAAFNTVSTDAANNVNAVFEAGVSGFFCGPVISENTDGVSVYMVGLDGTSGTGNTLYCYDGFAINNGVQATNLASTNQGWVVGVHQSGVGGIDSGGATVWATPALGKGTFNATTNWYSGNSLFVLDGVGGISVYNKNTGAFEMADAYGDATGVGGLSYASPVTDGQYLVLAMPSGITVYNSAAANRLGTNGLWAEEFTLANNYARNYQIVSTPVISNGSVVVALASADSLGNPRKGPGMVVAISLDGDRDDWYVTQSSAVASPIVSEGQVWLPEYTSIIYRLNAGAFVDGYSYSRQFKFDAAKSGENTEVDDDVAPGSEGGCFISTIK